MHEFMLVCMKLRWYARSYVSLFIDYIGMSVGYAGILVSYARFSVSYVGMLVSNDSMFVDYVGACWY